MNKSVSAPVREDSKKERIGTSGYAARADHKHPLEFAVGTEVVLPDVTGDAKPSWVTLDETEWTPGTNGIKLPVLVRSASSAATGTQYRYLIFRDFELSKNGNLIKVGKEYVGVRVRWN